MLPRPPESLHLVHSAQTKFQADAIAEVMRRRGVGAVQKVPVDAYDMAGIRRAVQEACREVPEDRIVANWTGGTKPMAVSLHHALPRAIKVYYEVGRGVAVAEGSFQPLPPAATPLALTDLAVLASVTYHKRQEGACNGPASIDAIARLAEHDPQNLRRLEEAKRRKGGPQLLHAGTLFQPKQFRFAAPKGLETAFFDALLKDGCAKESGRGMKITPTGEGFLSGFWWEQYVSAMLRAALRRLGRAAQDNVFRSNLKITWKDANGRIADNEADTVFIADDRLHVVTSGSVKTPMQAKVKRDEAQSIARRLGGTYHRVIVATLLREEQLSLARAGFRPDELLVPHFTQWPAFDQTLKGWLS